jgi:hypothetical protein
MSADLLILVLAVAAAAIVLLVVYLMSLARRLNRLHRRVEAARAVLDNQLVRRASAASDLAGSGALDPASSLVLADAATQALWAGQERESHRIIEPDSWSLLADKDAYVEKCESELSQILRVTADLKPAEFPSEQAWALPALAAASQRVEMARRFHNEAVLAAQAVRSKRIVRWVGVAGGAPAPLTVEIDDEVPPLLADPALLAIPDRHDDDDRSG